MTSFPIPFHILNMQEVQTVFLILLCLGMYWLHRRINKLELWMFNHFNHRFKKIQQVLNIEYEDEEKK